jgi:hypothetical protein
VKTLLRAIALLAAVACGAPAAAGAATENASSGQVSATLSYSHNTRDNTYGDLKIVIQRGGAVAFDQPITSEDCAYGCTAVAALAGHGSKSVNVTDLDGDGEPEILVDLFTGGAHCCLITEIFSFDGAAATYRRLEHNFADPGYTLKDLNGDGTPELRSADFRFAYSLASYAGSSLPPQIWRWRKGTLVDVTREFPDLIRAASKRHWKIYRRYIRNKDPLNDPGLGALAAWAGDEYLLGHGARVQRELRAALGRGWLNGGFTRGRGTIRALNKLLAEAGYR